MGNSRIVVVDDLNIVIQNYIIKRFFTGKFYLPSLNEQLFADNKFAKSLKFVESLKFLPFPFIFIWIILSN